MQLLSVIGMAVVAVIAALATTAGGSIVPINPISTTYALPATPVATSYQVVSRNVNRLAVPHIHPSAYPGYADIWGGYPYKYHLGLGYGYPYNHIHSYGNVLGYPYGYGTTIW